MVFPCTLPPDYFMIKVGIIEDHRDFRQSLTFLLGSAGDFKVAWSYESAEAALDKSSDADVILLDINLPAMSGIEAIVPLKKMYPEARIVMLTILEDDANVINAIRLGADGYMLKKTNPLKIMEAVRQVNEGGSPLTPSVARQVLSIFKSQNAQADQDYNLTAREKEILNLIVHGASTTGIAQMLFISEETVRNHIRHIYEKLQVHTKAQAVAKAIRERLT
ncbi:MAG: response regulator transcription factor [bacterium]